MLRWNKGKDVQEAGDAAGAGPAASGAAGAGVAHLGRSLPELLLSEGQVGKVALDRALAKQRETGAFLGEILVEQGEIDEKSLLSFLAKYCKIPHLSLLDYLIDKDILSLIPQEICLKHRLLPIDKLGRNLTVAMVNPLDVGALEVVRRQCPELRIKPILCAHKHFEIVTGRLFKTGSGDRVELSATSLGLKLSPAEKAAAEALATAPEPEPEPPVPAAPAPEAEAPAAAAETPADEAWPEAEEIPEAAEVGEPEESETPESPAAPAARESDSWISEVFRSGSGTDEESTSMPEAAAPGDEPSAMMKEMASVMMDSMRDTYAVLARRMDLFRGLKPEDVARIFACGATVEFDEGAAIFEKGQPGHAMYVVLGGEIAIEDEGRELAVLGRGDMFGEMGLLADAPRSAAARALTSASCLELSKEVVQNIATPEVSNQLLLNVIATLSQRLRTANERPGP